MTMRSDYKVLPGVTIDLTRIQVEVARAFRRLFDDALPAISSTASDALSSAIAAMAIILSTIEAAVAALQAAVAALQPAATGKVITASLTAAESAHAHGLGRVPQGWFPGSYPVSASAWTAVWQTKAPDATYVYLASYPSATVKVLVI